jgi:hypothetical protein
MVKPKVVANFKGLYENDVMASMANTSIFFKGYLVSPAKRSSLTYSTAVCLNPTQLTRPRI